MPRSLMARSRRPWVRGAVAVLFAVAIGVSCGGGDDASKDSTPEETAVAVSTPPTQPELGPQPDTTYVGAIDGEPGLAGTVTLVVGESGEEITKLLLDLEMDDYSCGDSTMSGGLGLGLSASIAIEGDAFQVSDETITWEGTFESGARAVGTVAGSLQGAPGGPPCEFGQFSWTAEPSVSAGLDESEQQTTSADETETPSAPTPKSNAATSDRFEDQFDGELGDGWQWWFENPEFWSLDDTPGWLTIVATDSVQNVLVREAPDDAFEVQTAVRFAPTSNFQFAGVFVGTDETSYVQLGRAYCSSADVPEFCVDDGVYMDEIDGIGPPLESSVRAIPNNPDVIHLRIVVDGYLVSGYFSDDAETWTLVGEHTLPGPSIGVGLIAGQAQLEPAVAEFDYFALSAIGSDPATPTEAVTTTEQATTTVVLATEPSIVAGEYEFAVTGAGIVPAVPMGGGLGMVPTDFGAGDQVLLVEFGLLSGDPAGFAALEIMATDGEGLDSSVFLANGTNLESTTMIGSDAQYEYASGTTHSWAYAVPGTTTGLALVFPSGEVVDLSPILP